MLPLNPYAALLKMLPNSPRKVGSVVASSGGSSTVQIEGGPEFQAIGGGFTPGDQVFLRNGAIEGQAPVLTRHVITV